MSYSINPFEVDMAWIKESLSQIKEQSPLKYRYLSLWLTRNTLLDDPDRWSEAVKALPDDKLEMFSRMVQRALEL